jgi:hypothetical protein
MSTIDEKLNEVLDIRYLDKNNEYQNKTITINKKIISDNNNVNVLKKNFESYLTIIYDNNSYLNEASKQNYEYIINFNLDKDCILKYVTKYFYLDYY